MNTPLYRKKSLNGVLPCSHFNPAKKGIAPIWRTLAQDFFESWAIIATNVPQAQPSSAFQPDLVRLCGHLHSFTERPTMDVKNPVVGERWIKLLRMLTNRRA